MKILSLATLALLNAEERKKKKKRLLFSGRWRTLVTHELDTVIYDDAFSSDSMGSMRGTVCYFPSLVSI
ncbi:unnamed protein product [Thlaspi arvense]|uniref:Uncharacterized protein n=1 Tax=Thlaspi arvense TaxID=13288 RepID=A0AAU9RGA4_THLAR|nr:unnamed protein product [Thlaspi arvense]